jgi:parvulin-like peptidyl-prolyl isomerase
MGILVSEFDRVAFCIPVGDISPVFQTDFGFHVAQVTDVRY